MKLSFLLYLFLALNTFSIAKSNCNIDLSQQGKAIDIAPMDAQISFATPYSISCDIIAESRISLIKDSIIYETDVSFAGAKAICFFFSSFDISPSGSFQITSDIEGAIRHYSLNNTASLSTTPISGQSFTLRLSTPVSIKKTELKLILSSFGVISNQFEKSKLKSTSTNSDYCNIDIACEEGAGWEETSRSVCKLLINNYKRCTGTIINNSSENGTPYILTANHCISDSISALNTVIILNHENSICNDLPKETTSISGSRLMATSFDKSIDFALIKLFEPFPETAKVYYAGWDIRDEQTTAATAIHHPKGDVKKISHSINYPVTDWFQDSRIGYTLIEDSHWKVERWDVGVTENGSSGGALFNAEKKVIGTLTGGDATCDSPVNDFYQKINYSWDYFTDSTQQLKYWLDPINSNLTSISGIGQSNYCSGGTDSLFSLKDPECSNSYIFGSNCENDSEFGKLLIREQPFLKGIGISVATNTLLNTDSIYFRIYETQNNSKKLICNLGISGSALQPQTFNEISFKNTVELPEAFFVSIFIPLTNSGIFSIYTNEIVGYDSRCELKINNEWISTQELGLRTEIPMCLYSSKTESYNQDAKITVEGIYTIEAREERIPQSDSIHIYPSIVHNGELTISILGAMEQQIGISLFDTKGILYAKHKRYLEKDGNTFKIDVGDLPNGVYILKIERSRITSVKQFTIINN